MKVQFEINIQDLSATERLWTLFSHVLALAHAQESADPRNEKFKDVHERLADARTLINEGQDLLDHLSAVTELGRAYECLFGDASLREQAKALSKLLFAQVQS